jgi:NADH-quinone oxidoreductase subunit F
VIGREMTDFQKSLAALVPLGRSGLLPALHAAQAQYGYVPEQAAAAIAQALGAPLADVHGVISFYSLFYNKPTGERILRVCADPACALHGAEEILQSACCSLGIEEGGNSPEGAWRVERTICLGLCNRAPAVSLTTQAEAAAVEGEAQNRSFGLIEGSTEKLLHFLAAHISTPGRDWIGGGPRLLTALCGGERAATLVEYEAAGGMQALRRWIGATQVPPGPDCRDQSLRAGRHGRSGFPHRAQMAGRSRGSRRSRNISSSTLMNPSRARLKTASCWRATPAVSWKGLSWALMPSAQQGLRLRARRIPAGGSSACRLRSTSWRRLDIWGGYPRLRL